jgi:DNA-binding Lrp family transcriptional regulator
MHPYCQTRHIAVRCLVVGERGMLLSAHESGAHGSPVAVNKLSAIDLKILEILQREGDISNVQLAEKVCLSPSPCLQRVRRLRALGYISGVAAIVDLKKIANHVIVHCRIRLSEQTTRHYAHFEATIQKIPEVIECSMISGEYDYLLKLAARDMQHFDRILTMMLEMDIGIKNHASMVEVKSVKRSLEMPLGKLLDGAGS